MRDESVRSSVRASFAFFNLTDLHRADSCYSLNILFISQDILVQVYVFNGDNGAWFFWLDLSTIGSDVHVLFTGKRQDLIGAVGIDLA